MTTTLEQCCVYGTAPTNEFDAQKITDMCNVLISLSDALKEIAKSAQNIAPVNMTGIIVNSSDR